MGQPSASDFGGASQSSANEHRRGRCDASSQSGVLRSEDQWPEAFVKPLNTSSWGNESVRAGSGKRQVSPLQAPLVLRDR